MQIKAVRLTTQGSAIVVDVETQNGWIEVIRELSDGPISHIVEESGLKAANREACHAASLNDLDDSFEGRGQ